MSEPPQFDLFVSYADADRAWVEGYLLDGLTAAGVRVYSESAFELGRPRLLEFERAVRQSKRTLLVLSPAYLADEAAAFVDLLAQTYGLESGTWPVVPLVLEPVELPPRLALLTRLEATDPAGWAVAVERLAADVQRPLPAPAATPPCPYPGMRPFAEADAPFFHGREDEAEDLVQRIAAQQGRERRFLAVIGPSGSGKSSLVFAGLIPKLRSSRLFGAGDWTVFSVRPGPAPMTAPTTVLGTDPPQPGLAFADLVAVPPDGRLLLVVDQFEELFTVARQRTLEDEAPFQEAVLRLAERPDCFVVLTVRADFYPELMASPLWPQIQAHRTEVLPLGEAGLRRAIVTPAERVGVYVEAALVERLATDAAGEPGVLPLVQQTLVLLWERVKRRFLPLRAYEALVLPRTAYSEAGPADAVPRTGLQVAVARHADATVAELDPEQQIIARRIFLRLVQPNEGRAATRRQRQVDELRSVGEDPARFAATLEHLAANRLLTLSGGEEAGGRTVDLAHEALIGGWPWLQHLITERGEAIRARQRLEDKTAEWVRLGRGRGGLLDEAELAEAERWLASPDAGELGYGEALPALVAASREELARELQRLRRRFLAATTFAALALVAAIISVYLFGRANNEANARAAEVVVRSTAEANALANEQQANEAQETAVAEADRSRVLAMAALAPRQHELGQDERGLLLARQAYLFDKAMGWKAHAQVDDGLRATLDTPAFSRILHDGEAPVLSVAVSPNEQLLAAGIGDPTLWPSNRKIQGSVVRVWDLSQQAADPAVLPHSAPVSEVSFAPDSQELATLDMNGTVRLWNLLQPGEEIELADATGATAIAFGPVGRVLVIARCLAYDSGECTDGEMRVLDLDHPSEVRILDLDYPESSSELENLFNQTGTVRSIAVAPGGDLLVSGDSRGNVRLWDLSQPGAKPVAFPHVAGILAGGITSVAFQADGQAVAAGSGTGIVSVWEIDRPDEPSPELSDFGAEVVSVAFSPVGQTLAAGNWDTGIHIWDRSQPTTDPVVLSAPASWPESLAFGPGGLTLASGHWDGTIRLWELGPPDATSATIADLDGEVRSVAFGLGDDTLAVGSCLRAKVRFNCDTGVSLFAFGPSAVSPTVVPTGDGYSGPVVAFDPSRQYLAAGSEDGVLLWDPGGSTGPRTLPKGGGQVMALAFDPEENTLAAGRSDGAVMVWDLRQPDPEPTVIDLGYAVIGEVIPVTTMAFDAEAERLAVGLDDGTVEVWLLAQPDAEPTTLAGGTAEIRALAFSADGARLVSGDEDGIVRVWHQPRSGNAPVNTLRGNDGAVLALAFNANGRVLASGGIDGTVRLWRMERPEAPPALLSGHSSRVWALAVSANGQMIAAGGGDGTVRTWSTTEALANEVCARVLRNLTLEEWRQFVGDPEHIPYQSTCDDLPPGEGAPEPPSSIATPVVTPNATSGEELATPATRPAPSA